MATEQLYVSMLGRFSLRLGARSIDDSSNRMRKVWLLLAYMLYVRNTRVTQSQFVSLLQSSGSEEMDDPSGRLKALFYRARTMLDQLGDSVGHNLIQYKNGCYTWNTDTPVELDVEVFDSLCTQAGQEEDEEERLALYLQALEVYRGDFLPKLSMESWVMPITAYYHQMFLDSAEHTLLLLETRSRWQEAEAICTRALKIEPYSESLFQHLMRCRLAAGDRNGARTAFEEMSELLFETFGVMPSDESRQLYREASRETNDQSVHISTVREQLRETESVKGAVLCEYDFFRLLYQVQARAIIRTGEVIHIALLSVHGQNRKELSRRSLDCAVENLQTLLLQNLRQGDVVSKCSVSQLVIMLPQANYENSCAVCQRIIKNFYRQYPHSPADIHYSVQPLEPTVPNAR